MKHITSIPRLTRVLIHVPKDETAYSSLRPSFADLRYLLRSLPNLSELALAPASHSPFTRIPLPPKWLQIAPSDRIRELSVSECFNMGQERVFSVQQLFPCLDTLRYTPPPPPWISQKPFVSFLNEYPQSLVELHSSGSLAAVLPLSPSLTKLRISAPESGGALEALQILSTCPHLRWLSLRITHPFQFPQFPSPAPQFCFPRLESLHFEETNTSFNTERYVAYLDVPMLHTLTFMGLAIKSLFGLDTFPSTLTHLAINGKKNIPASTMSILPRSLKCLLITGNTELFRDTPESNSWSQQLPTGLTRMVLSPSFVDWSAIPPFLEHLTVGRVYPLDLSKTTEWPTISSLAHIPPGRTILNRKKGLSVPLPATLTELQLETISPDQIELLPPSLRVLALDTGDEDWNVENMTKLLDRCPRLSLTLLGPPSLVLSSPIAKDAPSAAIDPARFSLAAHEEVVLNQLFSPTRRPAARVRTHWSIPDDFELPPNLRVLDCTYTSAFKTQNVAQMISHNLHRLSSLTSLTCSGPDVRGFRQDESLLNNWIQALPSLTSFIANFEPCLIDFKYLPRGLTFLALQIRTHKETQTFSSPHTGSMGVVPHGFGQPAFTSASITSQDSICYKPSALPPSLTKLKLIGYPFPAVSASQAWPQPLVHLHLTSQGWKDSHCEQIRSGLPNLRVLKIENN